MIGVSHGVNTELVHPMHSVVGKCEHPGEFDAGSAGLFWRPKRLYTNSHVQEIKQQNPHHLHADICKY